MRGFLALDAFFRARHSGREAELPARLTECEHWFDESCTRVVRTAERVATLIDDPTEQHILFRYNVRFVMPFHEFRKFIANLVDVHRGRPCGQTVNWEIIDPPSVA
jgi:hypothetical protein